MFLTHMPLNPRRRSTRDLIASPQRLHAAVLSAFPPGASERGRILWRLDQPERHRLDLYVVSLTAPSLEAMADEAGWPTAPEWRTADYRRFLDGLETGQRWVFRLRANPIRNERPPEGGRGKRVPILRVEGQIGWLNSRAEGLGFTLAAGEHGPNVRVLERDMAGFDRGRGGSRARVTLSMAAYEGVLEVQDPGRLRATLVDGIGSAKGYGCGLMTLAPVR